MKKIFEFVKICKACNKSIRCGLIRETEVLCPHCGGAIKDEKTLLNINTRHIIRFIKTLYPNQWMRNHSTNVKWDKLLNELLDNPNLKIERLDKWTILIDGIYEVWDENYPYAYGKLYDCQIKNKKIFNDYRVGMPKRITNIRLKEIVDDLDRSKGLK